MSPIRVAFISVVPSPYQRDLFAALARRPEIALSVFYLEAASPDSPWPEKPLASYEKILPGFWKPLGSARLHFNWGLPDFKQFDFVVLNTLISATAQRIMRCHLAGKPWYFWGERMRPRREGWKQALHDRMTAPLHRATGIVAIGSRAGQDYRERFPEPEHFNIPYHCELRPFMEAPRPKREDGEIIFLFCGQMISRKGVDLLLSAFERTTTHDKKAKLLLVGREAELPGFLAGMSAEARRGVVYAGFQPPEALPGYFAQADVFVLPSRYEGWGVVVNQAVGAGLPVICSDAVGAGHDLVEEEVNGLKFKNGNVDALTDKMRRFVTEPALSAKLGEASRRKAAEWLPENGAEKWIRIFQNKQPR